MSTSHTFTVRGFKLRCASRRRYIVVQIQPRDYETRTAIFTGGQITTQPLTVKACARVYKRSDNLAAARMYSRRHAVMSNGTYTVVIDQTTGEKV